MKRLLLGLAIIIGALVLTSGGYWYFFVYKPAQLRTTYFKEIQKAQYLRQAGRIEESPEVFAEALKLAPTQQTATYAKIYLAFTTFIRNQGDDREKAAAMLKEIIADPTILPLHRTVSIAGLMSFYRRVGDEEFARKVIFNGEPFDKFLKEAKSVGYQQDSQDLEYASRRAHETAEELYPFAPIEFRIAGWYSNALESGLAQDETQKQEFLSELQQWIQKGETNTPAYLRLKTMKNRQGSLYQLNGMRRRELAKFTDGDYSQAEAAFKKALEVIVPEEAAVQRLGVGMFIRFHYVAMLAETDYKARKNDIIEILKPIWSPLPPQFQNYPFSFYEFLKAETDKAHDAHSHKKDLIRLSQLVPEFRSFLESRGIQY